MKQKLFPLLLFLMTFVVGANATRTLIAKVELSGNTVTATSGTLYGSNAVNIESGGKIGGQGHYVAITLSNGNYFRAGDEVVIGVTKHVQVFEGGLGANGDTNATPLLTIESATDGFYTGTIPSTITANTSTISVGRTSSSYNGIISSFAIYRDISEEAFTVSFEAGDYGTYTGGDIEEESAGAGIILPSLNSVEDGYTFNGWFTASTGGTKAGDAGDAYAPTESTTLYAQYSAFSAPTIDVTDTNVETYKGVAITLTATADGAPEPTVTWYQSSSAVATDGTEVGTGLTYQPDVTAEGTYYYYAVASNSQGNATSDVITLTVNNPDKTATNNAYYMSVHEVAVNGEKIIGDDITMTFTHGNTTTVGTAQADNSVNSINENMVASVGGTVNGWSTDFVATSDGTLSVGVVINNDKEFSITNVESFSYQNTSDNGTIASNTWKPSEKFYGIITIAVTAGTTYSFSVSGSKMSFYGFEFDADNRAASDLTLTSESSVTIDAVEGTATVTWTSSAAAENITVSIDNPDIANVSSGEGTATITAVSEGTTKIIIKQENDPDYRDATIEIPLQVGATVTEFNIAAILNNQSGTLIESAEQVQGTTVNFGINSASERVDADAADAIVIVNGKYHSDHGLSNVSFTVKAPGNVKISVGECTYSGGKITVKNSENETVATKTPVKDCWKNDHSQVAVLYYEGDATTLTISGMSYCPYIAVETVEDVPALYTTQFYNGETLVSTVETYEGTTLDVPADPEVDEGEIFIGWYTATDGTGNKATSATVPTANGTYYANILSLTTTNGYVVVDNSGTDRKNGESFLAALTYANANSTQANPVQIFIPNGTYDLGTVAGTTISGSYISFIGESMDGVVILSTPENEGLGKADLLYNKGAHNYFQNLTLKNNYPYGNSTGRAAAFHDQGSFTIFKDCYLNSHQDTYYSHQVGKYFYFEGGKISGCVDYMCGNGKVFYEGVTLVNDNRLTYMTANSELYVYNNCIVENEGTNKYYWGRAWSDNPTCIFLNTTLKDNGSNLGSDRWYLTGLNCDYGKAGEYGTLNAEGTDITPESNTVTFTKASTTMNTILTSTEAATYSYSNFFASANWDPAEDVKTYSNTITVGETGFATVSFPYATTIPSDVDAYYVSESTATTVTLKKVTSSTVAAGTGLIISAAPGKYTFAARVDGTEYADNALVATSTGAYTVGTESVYVLAKNGDKGVAMKKAAEGVTVAVNKAYLPGAGSATKYFVFEGGETAIDGVAEAPAKAAAKGAFNVLGQAVGADAKGLVIVDGVAVIK